MTAKINQTSLVSCGQEHVLGQLGSHFRGENVERSGLSHPGEFLRALSGSFRGTSGAGGKGIKDTHPNATIERAPRWDG